MNNEYLANIHRKLERRFQRLKDVPPPSLYPEVTRFVRFIEANPLLSGIAEDLLRRNPDATEMAFKVDETAEPLFARTEEGNSALALAMLKLRSESPKQGIKVLAGKPRQMKEACGLRAAAFKSRFLPPVFDYFVEHLDDQRALLAMLRRYKHKCEWFRRDALLKLWQEDKAKGERLLANDLYEYLYDQGLEFAIEPTSASGKPDLVSAQVGNERLIADAKVYGDGTPKTYLAKGFHQIYQYTLDYNQPFGYLVIFKTCEADLKFPLEGQEQSIPFLTHNNKTIFFVVVDICDHEATASKRGVMKTIVVTQDDLVQTVGVKRGADRGGGDWAERDGE